MKAKHDMKEAIQQAVFNVRLCVPVKYKKFHDLRENDNILIVDFPLKQWTDVVGNEFTKQFDQYDGGFIETLKLYAESNYNDFLLYPADEHKILMGVQFHNTEHIKRLVDVLAALSGEKTQGKQSEQAAPMLEISNEANGILKDYFKNSFKGIGNGNINYFDEYLIPSLTVPRNAKETAKIALMIYHSNKVDKTKLPKAFSQWLEVFCACLGYGKEKTESVKRYKPNQLENVTVSGNFSYL